MRGLFFTEGIIAGDVTGGAKIIKGTGSIFAKERKNLHLFHFVPSFDNFFGGFWKSPKSNMPKTGLSCSTWTNNCTTESPVLSL